LKLYLIKIIVCILLLIIKVKNITKMYFKLTKAKIFKLSAKFNYFKLEVPIWIVMIDRLLFLDIDGVLNTSMMTQVSTFQLHPKLVKRFWHDIVTKTGCRVVVSSTWRRSVSHMQFFHTKLIEAGSPGDLSKHIVGSTPLIIDSGTASELRVREIIKFCEERDDVCAEGTNIVVVDDLDLQFSDCGKFQLNFVRVNPESGLSVSNVQEVVQQLMNRTL